MKIKFLIIQFIFTLTIPFCSSGQDVTPHSIGIVVSNIEKSTEWYENVLTLEVYKEMSFPEYDSLKINFLKGKHFKLELIEKKTSFPINKYVKNYDVNNEPLIGYAKAAFSVRDIVAEYDRLKKMNIDFMMEITEDKEFNTSYFIIRDPDKNLIQFIEQKTN